ncbi:MAG: polysaccharide biosynthesis C-terminal domain-containing protein, partial [Balneolaceae bacterium]
SLWYKGIEKVSLLVIPLTIMVIITAGDLISILFETENTSYKAAILPFQIYNLIVLIRVTHYGSILQAFGDTKGILYFSLNLLVANLILSLPMTYFFGIAGTATATLIANIYNLVIVLKRIGTHMELPLKKVLPFPFYFKVLGISVSTALPVWAVRNFFISTEESILGIIWSMLAFLTLYAMIGTLLKIISKDDWLKFKKWISLSFMWK